MVVKPLSFNLPGMRIPGFFFWKKGESNGHYFCISCTNKLKSIIERLDEFKTQKDHD